MKVAHLVHFREIFSSPRLRPSQNFELDTPKRFAALKKVSKTVHKKPDMVAFIIETGILNKNK